MLRERDTQDIGGLEREQSPRLGVEGKKVLKASEPGQSKR